VTAVDFALRYADRGWHVFPVTPAPNKRPLNKGGFLEATTDHERIVEWWEQWPSAQVGVACGASGLVALDVDSKPDENVDGWVAVQELESEHGFLGYELAMKTPRGKGAQLFFADPLAACRRRLGVLHGVDVLGDGGYTIVPSPSSPGRSWKVGDPFELEDLVIAPAWLVKMAQGPVAEGSAGKRSASRALPENAVLPPDTVADIQAALRCIPNEERGLWIRVGMALKASGAGEQAYAIWVEWSKPSAKFDPKDQRYQWDRLDVAREDGSEVSLETLFWLAQEHGYEGMVPGEDYADVRFGGVEEPTAAAEEEPEKPKPKPELVVTDWEDVANLPPIEWQVEDYVPEQSIMLMGGDSEAGKSFLSIHLAMCLVHGLPFMGRGVEACSVVYLAGEGHAGMAARFRAWRAANAWRGLDNGGRYCVVSSKVPVLSKKTMPKAEELIAQITEWKGHAPGLIVIDTLSQGLEDDENDAKVVAPVIRGLMAMRERWACCVSIVHHLVKLNTKGKNGNVRPTRDSVRGSSALTRNVDTVLGLVVDGEHHGSRVLEVWKQKDGEKPKPQRMWLHPVETGQARANGEPEWSCVFLPDASEGLCRRGWDGKPKAGDAEGADDDRPAEGPTGGENPHAVAAFKAAVDTVVATVRALGAVEGPGCTGGCSGSEVAEAAGIKRQTVFAALKWAGSNGLLKNLGTEQACKWAVPESAGTGEEAGTGE